MTEAEEPAHAGLTDGAARALLGAEFFERAGYYAVRLQLAIFIVLGAGEADDAASGVATAFMVLIVTETMTPVALTQLLKVRHTVGTAVAFLILRMAALFGLAFGPTQGGLLALLALLGASAGGYRAGHAAAFSRELEQWRTERSRTRGWSMVYVVGNVGFVAGAVIGAWTRRESWGLLWSSSALLLLVAVGALLVVSRIRARADREWVDSGLFPRPSLDDPSGPIGRVAVASFVAVLVGLAAYYVCYNSIFDFLPARLDAIAGAAHLTTPVAAELLVVLNPILVILLAPALSRVLPGRVAAPLTLGTFLAAAGLFVAAWWISVPAILLGLLLFTLGELLISPRRFQFMLQVLGNRNRSTAVSAALVPSLVGWSLTSVVLLPEAVRQDLTVGAARPIAFAAAAIGVVALVLFAGVLLAGGRADGAPDVSGERARPRAIR